MLTEGNREQLVEMHGERRDVTREEAEEQHGKVQRAEEIVGGRGLAAGRPHAPSAAARRAARTASTTSRATPAGTAGATAKHFGERAPAAG